jgi:hypothetical protein
MAYHGTIEVYAKEGATKGYKCIEGSFYTTLIRDIGQLAADYVIENILKHVQTSLKKYNSINTGSIQYDATDNPDTIIHIISDSDYEEIEIAPYRIKKNDFKYVVSFGELTFEEDSENVNNRHRIYNNRNRSYSRSKSRSRSRSTRRTRSRSTRRSRTRRNSRK